MATHTYEVPEGNNVLARFVGTSITLNEPDTLAEAIPKYFANEQALLASALRDRRILANRKVRAVLSQEDGSQAKAVEAGNSVVVGAPRPVQPAKAKTPQAQARATATNIGSTMLEKAIADPKYAQQVIDMELATRDMIEAYRANRNAPKPATAPKGAPKADAGSPTGTTAPKVGADERAKAAATKGNRK